MLILTVVGQLVWGVPYLLNLLCQERALITCPMGWIRIKGSLGRPWHMLYLLSVFPSSL